MALRGRGGASSGAFINLHVFRRENHFLQPVGECVHGHVRRDLQQRGYITLLIEATTTDLVIYRLCFLHSISTYY